MFVREIKKPNDRVSIRIVESHRVGDKVKQKIVTGIGTAHKSDIERIKTLKSIAEEVLIKLRNHDKPALPGLEEVAHATTKKTKASSDKVSISTLKEKARTNKGIEDVFGSKFKQLSLLDCIDSGYKKEESNDLFKEIILDRISSPSSKRQSVGNIKRSKGLSLNLDKVYRMMDKVYENKDRIRNKICSETTNLLKENVDVAFFDVTTLYFESFIPDDLRVSGFSKDGKFKETQVMLALITTTGGLPIGYELFPGNSYEGNTLLKVIEKVEEKYNLSDTFVVADRAMFTKTNLSSLDEKGVKFIVAAKLKGMKKAFQKEILHDISFALKENPSLESWVKEYDFEKYRLVVSYSKKRASKDKKDRERLVERVKKKMSNGKVIIADLINNTGTKKYLKIEKAGAKEATLDDDKISHQEKWDGLHAVITNHKSENTSSNEILAKYKGLWQIEEAFRINKHDLKMRPIYHWTEKRIQAHILICFVAFTLVAFVRHDLKKKNLNLSFKKTREELNNLQVSLVEDSGSKKRFLLPSKITDNQRMIYSALGLKLQQTPTIID